MKLAEIFKSGMVLQRDQQITFWGENDSLREVVVRISGVEVAKEKIAGGRFAISIPPQRTAWNETIEFVEDDIVLERLDNVKIGEVWLCGGQSNMELNITYDELYKKLKKSDLSKNIFFYETPKRYAPGMESIQKIRAQGQWYPCNKDTLEQWASVPYHFANKLALEMPDCPIGVVSCNMGGSNLLCWLPREIIEEEQQLSKFYEAYVEHCKSLNMESYQNKFYDSLLKQDTGLIGLFGKMYMKGKFPKWFLDMQWKNNTEALVSQQAYGPWDSMRPGGLYEYMLQPLFGFCFRGTIWYQGESEAKSDRVDIYTHTMKLLVERWRKDFDSNFPFVVVVLPRFEKDILDNGVLFPEIRRQQRELPNHISNLYVIEEYESGMPYNIHSTKKRPIGEALARECLHQIYKISK